MGKRRDLCRSVQQDKVCECAVQECGMEMAALSYSEN
jgi:hypothetical protein